MEGPRNLLYEHAALIVDGFAEACEDRQKADRLLIVASPGSRSTPFLLAALEHPAIDVCVLHDERVAGFFALGQVRATGRPVALLATSGTAGAHWLPAVIEASEQQLPLLLLTADRPPELRGCQAPQTIDQRGLFGRFVRGDFEMGVAEAHQAALAATRRRAAAARRLTRTPRPGPVHCNLAARKPLEPRSLADLEQAAAAGGEAPPSDDERKLTCRALEIRARAAGAGTVPERQPGAEAIAEVVRIVRAARSGLIRCGALPLCVTDRIEGLDALARLTGFPVAAEVASGLRHVVSPERRIDRLSWLLDSPAFTAADPPEVILEFGAASIVANFGAWAGGRVADATSPGGASPSRRIVFSDGARFDPDGQTDMLLDGELRLSVAALVAALDEGADHPSYRAPSQLAARAVASSRAVEEAVAAGLASSRGRLTEGVAVRRLLEWLPPDSLLGLGNSLPIRLVEDYAGDLPTRVVSQRGANGIDGLVSGFAGSVCALEHRGASPPVALLVLGDVTLLHDLGGLAALAEIEETRVVVAVLNNDGGRIFERLPVASTLDEESMRAFTTPHGRSFGGVARTFGLDYEVVATTGDLDRALAAGSGNRPTLLEVSVPVASTEGALSAHDERQRLTGLVNEVVGDLLRSQASALAPDLRSRFSS